MVFNIVQSVNVIEHPSPTACRLLPEQKPTIPEIVKKTLLLKSLHFTYDPLI